MRLPRCFLLLFLFAGEALARGATPVVIEAENAAPEAASRVADATASGGVYVTSGKLWQTLAVVDVPPAPENGRLSIWVRLRGLPVALKAAGDAATGSKERELRWIYRPPAQWEWRHAGTFTRKELGDRVRFMRGRGDAVDGGLDAVFLGPPDSSPLQTIPAQAGAIEQDALNDDTAPAAASAAGGAQDEPVRARVSIDWSRAEQTTSRRQFSINATAGSRASIASSPAYARGMDYLHAAVLRYHKGIAPREFPDPAKRTAASGGWTDLDNRGWHRGRIREAFEAFHPPDTDIVVSIAHWPPWMDKDKRLDPDRYGDFAAHCAELVRILNVEQRRGVRYFEILNERDFVYWRAQLKAGEPPLTAELAKIFLLCAEAMKKVDPTIKTGGPAAASGENNVFPMHREFVQLTRPQLDFFSFHGYATGTAGQSDAFIYDKAGWLGGLIRRHRLLLDELSPDRHIELHFNEYNIGWTWRIAEPRMRNHKGAVFDSLLLIAAVKAGADVTNAWNDQEGTYGKLDPQNDFAPRPGAHVFHYFNHWLAGQSGAAASDQPRAVVPFAVDSGARRAFVLINRSGAENTVDLAFAGGAAPSGLVSVARIAEPGLEKSELPAGALGAPFRLPPHSVTFYSYAP